MKFENQKTKLIIQKKIEEKECKKIAICSSIRTKTFYNYIKKIRQELENENFTQVTFFIENEENNLKYLLGCDAVILVEKYTETRYKEFNEMTEMLREMCLPILGVITI